MSAQHLSDVFPSQEAPRFMSLAAFSRQLGYSAEITSLALAMSDFDEQFDAAKGDKQTQLAVQRQMENHLNNNAMYVEQAAGVRRQYIDYLRQQNVI